MNKSLKNFLSQLNAQPLDPEILDEYKKEMTERVIPEIVDAVKERQRLAAESRINPIRRPATPTRKTD